MGFQTSAIVAELLYVWDTWLVTGKCEAQNAPTVKKKSRCDEDPSLPVSLSPLRPNYRLRCADD